MIDLRSDTVTRPTAAMLDAMQTAQTGDDVFAEDPTTVELEERCADMFGHEAALYCPSGTMTNQIAINVHVRPGDEVICDRLSHIYNYEGGGVARNSGASMRLLNGDRGCFDATSAMAEINPIDSHYARTSLVCVEDTCNKGGGSVWKFDALKSLSEACKANRLPLHLDGARCWNAMIHRGGPELPAPEVWRAYGQLFDSISICFSKGMGAPVGSVVLGSKSFIQEAHRTRKVLGGGMRQIGGLAAACLHAIDHQLPLLSVDHQHAHQLGAALEQASFVSHVDAVQTNIVIFELNASLTADDFVAWAAKSGFLCFAFGPQKVRFVTHRDVSNAQIQEVCDRISEAQF